MFTSALMCMALNIYHEARGEPLVGQIAVAQVVMNRVESPQYPDTVCDVVKQGKYSNGLPVRHKCQFSWWCDGKPDKPKDQARWEQSQALAENILLKSIPDITEGALFYHATHVRPYWADRFTQIAQIENHIFYR